MLFSSRKMMLGRRQRWLLRDIPSSLLFSIIPSPAFHTINGTTVASGCRPFSGWTRGTDLLEGSLKYGQHPKIILDSYAPSGFDVSGMITKVAEDEEAASGAVHMNSSILAFPHSCFLWKVSKVSDITVESLASVLLYRPKLEYLFLGTPDPVPQEQMERIKTELREKGGIVVERLNLANAMGTFNILNGEDRSVAIALLLEAEPAVSDKS